MGTKTLKDLQEGIDIRSLQQRIVHRDIASTMVAMTPCHRGFLLTPVLARTLRTPLDVRATAGGRGSRCRHPNNNDAI
jgi:hypothetical protein